MNKNESNFLNLFEEKKPFFYSFSSKMRGIPEMETTFTLDLPDSAIVSEKYDSETNSANLVLTVGTKDIPFLAKSLLEGIPQQQKDTSSIEIKLAIAKASGFRFIYRLPSLFRAWSIGVATGVVLKEISKNARITEIIRAILGAKAGGCLNILFRSMDRIPCIFAAAVVAGAVATSYIPEKWANLTDSLAEDLLKGSTKMVSLIDTTLSNTNGHNLSEKN